MADLSKILTKEEHDVYQSCTITSKRNSTVDGKRLKVLLAIIDRLASLVPAAKEATPAAVPEGVRGFIAGDGGTHLWIGDEKYIKVSGDWSHIGTDRDFEECLKFWELRSGKARILSGSQLATAYADWRKGQKQ